MPTYVYACNECGAQFEQFQRFSDEPIKTCPRCQGVVRRVFQPVGIMFKGSGWYVTDSRSSNSAGTSSSESSKSNSSSESASESTTTPDSTDSNTSSKTDPPAKDSTTPKESSTSTSS